MSFAPEFGLAPVVSKIDLAAMKPHTRSECMALMREAGLSAEQIARPLNVRPEVVNRIADARHGFQLPKVVLAGEQQDEDDDQPKRRDDGLPRGCFIILKFAAERNFEFALSKDGLSLELGVALKVIDAGMTRLLDDGYILKLRAGIGGKPPVYRVTERGEQIAAAVFNLAAAEA